MIKTAGYFGISTKTFHKWKARFNPRVIQSLEEKSKAPIKRRTGEVTALEGRRVVKLRNQTRRKRGKAKLKTLYQQKYREDISTWKIERVVQKHKLYPDPVEQEKKAYPAPGARRHNYSGGTESEGTFTAPEDTSRLAFARVYERDFDPGSQFS